MMLDIARDYDVLAERAYLNGRTPYDFVSYCLISFGATERLNSIRATKWTDPPSLFSIPAHHVFLATRRTQPNDAL
jgi:hypothetical protein